MMDDLTSTSLVATKDEIRFTEGHTLGVAHGRASERERVAEAFADMCETPAGLPHKCSVLIAAHDVARIIRELTP